MSEQEFIGLIASYVGHNLEIIDPSNEMDTSSDEDDFLFERDGESERYSLFMRGKERNFRRLIMMMWESKNISCHIIVLKYFSEYLEETTNESCGDALHNGKVEEFDPENWDYYLRLYRQKIIHEKGIFRPLDYGVPHFTNHIIPRLGKCRLVDMKKVELVALGSNRNYRVIDKVRELLLDEKILEKKSITAPRYGSARKAKMYIDQETYTDNIEGLFMSLSGNGRAISILWSGTDINYKYAIEYGDKEIFQEYGEQIGEYLAARKYPVYLLKYLNDNTSAADLIVKYPLLLIPEYALRNGDSRIILMALKALRSDVYFTHTKEIYGMLSKVFAIELMCGVSYGFDFDFSERMGYSFDAKYIARRLSKNKNKEVVRFMLDRIDLFDRKCVYARLDRDTLLHLWHNDERFLTQFYLLNAETIALDIVADCPEKIEKVIEEAFRLSEENDDVVIDDDKLDIHEWEPGYLESFPDDILHGEPTDYLEEFGLSDNNASVTYITKEQIMFSVMSRAAYCLYRLKRDYARFSEKMDIERRKNPPQIFHKILSRSESWRNVFHRSSYF